MTDLAATRSPSTDTSPWWTAATAQRAALVLLVVLAYLPIVHAGFVWDDDTHLTANPCIIGPLGLKEIWTTSSANYFPLVLTTFWMEHALWGLQPLPYHVVNLAFHAATVLLLVEVLRQLRVRVPWFGAALWALHPQQVESVAWVSELTNVLSGFFFVLAIRLYVARPQLSYRRLAAVALCAVAAMLSKPSTVMLPVVLLLCQWWSDETCFWRRALKLTPLFLLSLVVSGWTVWEQKYHSLALGPEWQFDVVTRLAIAGRDVWFYLGKLLYPSPLAFVYARWRVPQAAVDLWPALLVVATWIALWTQRRGRLRPVFFGATYFLALLFPVLGFFDVYYFRYSFVADHFQYLAAMAPLAGLAAVVDLLATKYVARHTARLVPYAAAAVLLVAGGISFAQARTFESSATLWQATLRANPDCWIAETIVGNMEARAGRYGEAARRHRHAIELDPLAFEPHYNLGIALAGLGQNREAIAEYERALQLKPDDPDTEHNFGVSLVALDRPGDAVVHYERALRLRPNFAPTEVMLALALTVSNRAAEALPHYENAIRLQPHNNKAQYSYARTLEILGRYDDAVPHFRAAIQVAPNDAAAHGYLGLTLASLHDPDNAVAELEQAVRLEPANTEWRDALAKLPR